MSYLDWNNAIYGHFYPPELGDKPIFLTVDDEVIAEVGRDIGIEDDAIGNFLHFVREQSRLGSIHGSKFEWFVKMRGIWFYQPNVFPCPPYVGLLALTVLAASRMTANEEYSSANYYVHLQELLDADRITENDKLKLDGFWEDLREFLLVTDTVSTISTHEHFSHIGYPLSQIFLRKADIERFSEFFHWGGITRDELASDSRLLMRFFEWSNKTTCHLNTHFYDFVNSGMFDDQNQKMLAGILRQEYQKWQNGESPTSGAVANRVGSSRGKAFELLLEEDFGEVSAKLVTEFAGEPPDEETITRFIATWPGEEPDISPDTGWIVVPLDEKRLTDALTCGVEFRLGGMTYRFSSSPVLVMGEEKETWSGWLTQPALVFDEKQAVLAHRSMWPFLQAYLTQYARDGWSAMHIGTDYGLFLNVTIPQQAILPLTDERLACLVPKQKISICLVGGVKLARTCWVKGYEPTLAVTGGCEIVLDDRVISTVTGSHAEIPLTRRNLQAGRHTIQAGQRIVQFQLDDLTQEKPFDPTRTGGYVVAVGNTTHHRLLTAVEIASQVTIQGVQVSNDRSHIVRIAPNHRQYVILGACPGQVFDFKPNYRITEPTFIDAPFEPLWLISIGKKDRRNLQLVGKPEITWKRPQGREKIAGVRKWHFWVNRSFENLKNGKKPFRYKDLWDAYRALAE